MSPVFSYLLSIRCVAHLYILSPTQQCRVPLL